MTNCLSHTNRDFSLATYAKLVAALRTAGYRLMTFRDFCSTPAADRKIAILRHDVDARPSNSVTMAKLEYELGVSASYYFRIVPKSFSPTAITAIERMGHEVGYHYEDLALAKGNAELGIELFRGNLKRFAGLCDVSTICMHGSPLSRWDNRALWKRHDYREFGLIGEPYLVLDFTEWLYLTDTGMQWNGADVSVRDKVSDKFACSFRKTSEIIEAFRTREMPSHVMINTHPQRWDDNSLHFARELLLQRTKNVLKRQLIRFCAATWDQRG